MTANTVVETLGSALGLWLGLGVIQLAEKIEYIFSKTKKVIKLIKSDANKKNIASTNESPKPISSDEKGPS